MAKVIIAFDPDPARHGQTVDVDDVEARTMVRQGRARYAPAEPEPTPEPAPSRARYRASSAETE